MIGAFRRRNRVHEDLAETCGDWPRLRLHALGKLAAHLHQPLVDQLARKIDVGAFFENSRDLRKAIS